MVTLPIHYFVLEMQIPHFFFFYLTRFHPNAREIGKSNSACGAAYEKQLYPTKEGE